MKYKIRKHSKFFQLCESLDFDRVCINTLDKPCDTNLYAATIDGVDILIHVPDEMKLFDPKVKEPGFDNDDMIQLLLYYQRNRQRGHTVRTVLESWLKQRK